MKLKNQLSFGFGTVTLLLIVLSTISFFKFNDVDKEFDNYRALAIASMSTGGVQASILETILAVDEYLEHPTQENITPVNNRLSSSIQLINTMLLNATDPEDNVQLEQIKSNLVNYGASFQRVTNLLSLLQEEREQKSIPSGLAMQKITSKLTSLFRDNAEVSEILDELQEDVLLARLYEAKYTASNKISDAKKAENELSKIENVTSSLKNIEMGELPSQELIAFNRAFNTYKKAFNTNKKAIMSLHSIVNTELDTISELTSTAISNINDRTEVKQNKIGPQMVKGINNAKSFLLIISIISIVTAIGIALFIYKNISTIVGGEPTDIAKLVKKVAEGDISTHLSISGKETGIYKNIIEMRIELKRIIDGLHSSLDNVSSASVELAAVMVQTESNAQQELSQVEQIATAINELSSTATEVSQNASSAEHAANEAITNVDLGQSALTLSNDVSDKIETSIKETTEIVNQLREYSIEIGTVVEVINSISEQTNLLALNAAIEAARAGEQGRGFAVVADEVRSLAAKTQESTVDIQDIISRLQEQATKANDHMKGNISLVDSSKENSNKLHSAFVHITNSVTLISDMNTQVATASEEQSGVTQDISENVNLTFDLVNQNVTGIHQSKTASEELSSLAEQQKILLGFFKNS